MKKIHLNLITVLFLFIIPLCLWAQSPVKMSYQAVVRNSSGQLITNQQVGVRISILQGSDSGTSVYTETQKPTTNANGLLSIAIGDGTVVTGNLSATNWANGPYYLKTETDPTGGTSYSITGTSQLLSVPYALYAQQAGNVNDADTDPTNEIQTLSLSGTQLSLSKNGGTVTLPAGGSADNWGSQTVATDATLTGNGLTATPLKIAQQGATSGQVLKWNGTSWAPGSDAAGSGGLTLPYNQTISNSDYAFSIINSGNSAIKGVASSTTGTNYGVYGETSSSDGFGIYGYNSNPMGYSKGIYGKAVSTLGMGVYGIAPARGILGEASADNGNGIIGLASSASGQTTGVYGRSLSPDGTGVFGDAQKYGVRGLASSTSGIGVYGENYANIAVEGISTTGTAGVFNSTSGYALKTSGKLALAGIGEGAGKVLTSDASGNATWQTPPAFTLPYSASVDIPYSTSKPDMLGALSITNNSFNAIYGKTKSSNSAGVGGSGTGSGYSSGVMGDAGEGATPGLPGNTGVLGQCDSHIGVAGTAISGIGGYFSSSSGIALRADGKVLLIGNVGIGADDPGYRLSVNGSINSGSININCSSSAPAITCNGSEALWFNGDCYSWGYASKWNFFQHRVHIGGSNFNPDPYMLYVEGDVAKSTGSANWTIWSDIRLKDIHGNYEKGLSEIAALQPVNFTYKKDNACNLPSDKNYAGFVAQDVQKVFPEAVSEGKDGYLTLDVSSINVALVNAVKELKAQNDVLKQRLEKLEAIVVAQKK